MESRRHFEILRKMYLVVSTTKETAKSGLLVVESCLHVAFAMTVLVTTQWIGKFLELRINFGQRPILFFFFPNHCR